MRRQQNTRVIVSSRRARRRVRRNIPTDSGRDARLPRVPVTMPRFGVPPPVPRVVEVTPMKRELIEMPVDTPGTETPTAISQRSIIARLTALGLPSLSITLHRVLAYQINQQDAGIYDPLTLTDGFTGYKQEYAGVPGKMPPRGMITYPAQFSIPFLGTSTSTDTIASATYVDRLYVDISFVVKPSSSFAIHSSPSVDDISDFQTLAVVSHPPSVVSNASRVTRSRASLNK